MTIYGLKHYDRVHTVEVSELPALIRFIQILVKVHSGT